MKRFAALLFLLPCLAVAEDAREQFPGFSLVPPGGDEWVRVPRNEMAVLWRRDTGDDAKTFVMAVLAGPTPAAVRDQAQLLEFLREVRAAPPPSADLELVESKLDPSNAPAATCVRHASRIRSKSAGTTMEVEGLTCLHPDYPGRMIDVQYSQRSPAGGIDDELAAEGKAFLESIRFEEAPADDDWSLGEGAGAMQPREQS
jgi:hypothetical protein